jgi:hypothetical protein
MSDPLSTGAGADNQWLTDISKFFVQPEEEMTADNPADANATPRGTGLLQVPGNAIHNLGDVTQGLGVAGTVVGSRMLETLPSVSDQGDVQWGQTPVRMSDLDDIGRTVDAVFNSYKDNYLDPLLEGRYSDIYGYAAKHPLDVASDALSLAPLKAGKVGALIDKAGLAVGSKAAEVGKGLVGKIEKTALANEDLAPIAERLRAKAEGYNIRSSRDQALMDDLKKTLPEMQRLYAAVPKQYRPVMKDILEGRHPEVLLNGYTRLPKEVNEFRQAVQMFTEKRLQQLKEMGVVTEESAEADRFKPMLSEYLNTVRGAKNVDVNKLFPHQITALTKEAQAYAKHKGFTPVYQMRGSSKQIGKIISDPLSTPEWLHKMMKGRAAGAGDPHILASIESLQQSIKHTKRELKNALTPEEAEVWQQTLEHKEATLKALKHSQGDSQHFGREYQRTLVNNEAVESDALKVSMASDIQTAQAYHTYKAFLESVAQKAIPFSKMTAKEHQLLAEGKLAILEPKNLFGQIEFGPKLLHDLFPEPMVVPRQVMEALNHLTNWRKGSFEKLLAGFANFARKYVLGYNLLFPEKQQLQNWFMLGMTQFNGPRDTLLSFASYAMAHNKEIQKRIPAHFLAEQFAAEAATDSKTLVGAAGKAFDAIPNQTFMRAQIYDRYTRAAAAIYYGLKVSETDAKLGKIITGMVANGEAINRLETAFKTPEMYAQIAKQIETTLGDYSALKASQRAGIRSLLLWWLWYEHIVKFTASLTHTNPIKMSLMHAITKVYPTLFQEDVPDGQLKEAGAIMLPDRSNPQGKPLATMSGGFNPFTTVGELVEMTGQPWSNKASSTFLGASNPIFTFAAFMFGINPQTGQGYRDPNLISLGGRQYRPEDVAAGRLIEQRPSPDKLEFILRTFFPNPTRTTERIYEKMVSGGEPSQFTAVAANNSAPRKLFGAHGAPLEAGSLFDTIAQSIIGQRAFPVDTESARRQKLLEHKRLSQAYRAMMLQMGGSPY